MFLSRSLTICLIRCALALPALALAEVPAGPALTGKLGSLGIGAELELPLSATTALRTGLNGFSYDTSARLGDNPFALALTLRSASLLVDWRPWHSRLKLGAGVFRNANQLRGSAALSEEYQVGDSTYAPEEIGRLSADVEFAEFAPYIGFGWDKPIGREGLGMALEIGLLYQGRPKVRLNTDGPASAIASFQEDLEREQMELQAELSSYRFYPVGSFGLSLRF